MKTLKMNNIENIISQRLNLDTNRRILSEEFGLPFADLNKLTNKSLLAQYANWSQEKRNKFIVIVGGRVNFKQTQNYLDQKVKGK